MHKYVAIQQGWEKKTAPKKKFDDKSDGAHWMKNK